MCPRAHARTCTLHDRVRVPCRAMPVRIIVQRSMIVPANKWLASFLSHAVIPVQLRNEFSDVCASGKLEEVEKLLRDSDLEINPAEADALGRTPLAAAATVCRPHFPVVPLLVHEFSLTPIDPLHVHWCREVTRISSLSCWSSGSAGTY